MFLMLITNFCNCMVFIKILVINVSSHLYELTSNGIKQSTKGPYFFWESFLSKSFSFYLSLAPCSNILITLRITSCLSLYIHFQVTFFPCPGHRVQLVWNSSSLTKLTHGGHLSLSWFLTLFRLSLASSVFPVFQLTVFLFPDAV